MSDRIIDLMRERDAARSELERWRSIPTMDVPGTLHDDADEPTQIAFRLRWLNEELTIRTRERDAARAKTAQLREELDDMIAEYGAAMLAPDLLGSVADRADEMARRLFGDDDGGGE